MRTGTITHPNTRTRTQKKQYKRVSMGLTVSRKLAKILTDSRKSHHPIEILKQDTRIQTRM